MKRKEISNLLKWKESNDRKPLIIQGPRQVGKTWLMQEFGSLYYENTVYIDFEADLNLDNLFSKNLNAKDLISAIEALKKVKVKPDKTLIIFDEIQAVPRALTSLKYFYEQANNYHIIVSGSLLGISLMKNASFPVGKVDFLKLNPLTFAEFLLATKNDKLFKFLEEKKFDIVSSLKNNYFNLLKQYFLVGGMPEAVSSYITNNDYEKVKKIQSNILTSYESDFSKHSLNYSVPKLRLVWSSIISQLAKENKKFVYKLLKSGARASEYENAIMWLSDYGIIHKVNRSNAPNLLPLKAYEDYKSFKLYMSDIGLLCCKANINQSLIFEDNKLFSIFNGALTEQYVCQQLACNENLNFCYYSNKKNTLEIDFIIQHDNTVFPLEVKSSLNTKSKSLKSFDQIFNPEKIFRTSLHDFQKQGKITDFPLYAINQIFTKEN